MRKWNMTSAEWRPKESKLIEDDNKCTVCQFFSFMYSFIYMKNHINLVLLSFKSNIVFKLIVNLIIVTLVNGIFSFFMVGDPL